MVIGIFARRGGRNARHYRWDERLCATLMRHFLRLPCAPHPLPRGMSVALAARLATRNGWVYDPRCDRDALSLVTECVRRCPPRVALQSIRLAYAHHTVDRLGELEPPVLLREIRPLYTDEARRRSIEGDVVLEIVVRHDGSVGDVRVRRSLGAGLEQKAVDAVRQWRFGPARRRGTPVDVVVEVSVEFKLR